MCVGFVVVVVVVVVLFCFALLIKPVTGYACCKDRYAEKNNAVLH